jgi:hypothetical protein
MQKRRTRIPTRWMFLLLSLCGSWASGIYLGKMAVQRASTTLLIPVITLGRLSLLMAWGRFPPAEFLRAGSADIAASPGEAHSAFRSTDAP